MKNHTDYQTPICTVCIMEVEGDVLVTSSATWGGALRESLTYEIIGDNELN